MLPDSLWMLWLQLLIMASGFAALFRARRLTRWLFGMLGGSILVQVALSVLDPLLVFAGAGLAVGIVLLRSLRLILEALLGTHAAGTVLGYWALRVFDTLFLLPIRALRYILRWFGG